MTDATVPVLPEVKYPDLQMPEDPKVPGAPEDRQHKSCDGEDYVQPDYKNSPVSSPKPGVPRILIGIPVLSYTHEFVDSFTRFIVELSSDANKEYEIGYHFVYRKPVHMAEQVIVDMALYNKCTHVLFIDDDITDYCKGHLDLLVKADKDVVSGVMYTSKFPYNTCCFRRFDTTKKVIDMPTDNTMYRLYEVPCQCSNCGAPMSAWGEYFCGACGVKQNNLLQKVDLIPFPFTLLKTSVFQKLKEPWFHCTTKYPADSWFADRCLEAGVQQWAHMGVRLTHNSVNDITKQHYFNMHLEIKRRTDNPGIINIDNDNMNRHQYWLDKAMKEAEEKLKAKESPKFMPAGSKATT